MIETNKINFSVESAILRELGEQLVSKPEVALTELIKNAYDADAKSCEVDWTEKRINVKDSGHGMTFEQFKNRWMRIATSNKATDAASPKFGRTLTGSKGIGRFAVRFLGQKLTLVTVAKNESTNRNSKLVAHFNWNKLDDIPDIEGLQIRYRLYQDCDEPCGTLLSISALRAQPNPKILKDVKSATLSMTSPITAFLDRAPQHILSRHQLDRKISSHQEKKVIGDEDTFHLKFISPLLDKQTSTDNEESSDNKNYEDLTYSILKHSIARVNFYTKTDIDDTTKERSCRLFVSLYHVLGGNCYSEVFPIENIMGCDIYGEIHYFPLRGGVLSGLEVNGHVARDWIKNTPSVAVYDKGFRITPYGDRDDDWLHINADTSHSTRQWRTHWMKELFPISAEESIIPCVNPMLALPETHQLVGGLFVEAANSRVSKNINTLSPSTDRQGFIANRGFEQLNDITRFAVELIAKFDRSLRLKKEKEEREREFEKAWDDIDQTIKVIETVPSLSRDDRTRLTKQYERLRSDYTELSKKDQESRENLVTMGLLGVVAGFMTHEYESTLHELQLAQKRIRFLSKTYPELAQHAEKIDESIAAFNGYIDYTQAFISSTHEKEESQYKSAAQIRNVINTFSKFRKERSIDVELDSIERDLLGPNIPIAMYRGIIHNLYSNALKALTNFDKENKKIKIEAFQQGNRHIVRVMDNGPGIPPGSRTLIWDPLFTTTSNENNPLGSGMGLGLALVKRVIELKNGKIDLVNPPDGFSTCFEFSLKVTGD